MQKLITLGCLLPLLVSLTPRSSLARETRQPKTYALRPRRAPGAIDHVEAALEVTGNSKEVQDKKIQRFKLDIVANITYDERLLDSAARSDGPARSVRYYDKAAVLLKLEADEFRPTLRDERRLVGVQLKAPSVTLFSPKGALTRDELDLLEMYGSGASLLAYRLLPEKPVAVGDTWKPPPDLMAALLDWDAVSKTDVQSTLGEVTGGTARIDMAGRVEGAIDGVSTEIELKAKVYFNLAAGRITWFGLSSRENRAIGHLGTGLEALSRFQMKITPLEKSARLSDAALSGLSLVPTAELTRLTYESAEGGWRIVHDRRWHITYDENRLVVLRLIDRGELVAQCNIHTPVDASPDEEVTLAEFQDDIRHGLGDSFGQFVQASQRANEADYRVYRVVVAGQVQQLPIRWIYYVVADEHGRRVVIAFTVEGALLDRFGAADEELLGSLRLDSPKVAAEPTPAEPRAEEAGEAASPRAPGAAAETK